MNLAAPPRTLKEWLTEWLADNANDGTKASTIDRYRQVIDGHLTPHLGRIKLDRLTPRDVQRMVAALSMKLSTGSVVKVHGIGGEGARGAPGRAQRRHAAGPGAAQRCEVREAAEHRSV